MSKLNMNKYLQEREEINRRYNMPENRRLKYAAMIVIGIVIILILSMIIWMDKIPYEGILIMRGCVGLGAIIFVLLVAPQKQKLNR